MTSIIGFGGVVLRAEHPDTLYAWYEQHFQLVKAGSTYWFPVPTRPARITFALFGKEEPYFPLAQQAMINLQVDDLDAVLDRLIEAGVTVDPNRERYAFGTFGWCTDPEGNRIELWQPADPE